MATSPHSSPIQYGWALKIPEMGGQEKDCVPENSGKQTDRVILAKIEARRMKRIKKILFMRRNEELGQKHPVGRTGMVRNAG